MPTFNYTARNRAGKIQQGQLEAESLSLARQQLQEQGLWITQLRPARRTPAPDGRRAGFAERHLYHVYSGVSLRDLAGFYRQLAALCHSGFTLYQALDTLTRETPNRRLRRVIQQLAQETLQGRPLAPAMDACPWLFTELQRHMIRAAEAGGLLEPVLNRLAEYLEREWQIRMRIKQRLVYPFLVFLALIFVPKIKYLVLGQYHLYLLHIWGWTKHLFLAFLIYLGGRYLMKHEWFRHSYDEFKLALPLIGALVRKMAAARFARAMAALSHAGVWLNTALPAAADACANAKLRRMLHRAGPALERGARLSDAMRLTGFFPPMFLGMVETGEQSGNVDAMFDKAAEYYEREAEHAAVVLTIILGVALLGIVAILVAREVLGFYASYYGGAGQIE